jgi:hypothetical protein
MDDGTNGWKDSRHPLLYVIINFHC